MSRRRTQDMIFSLKAGNNRARKAIDDDINRDWASDKWYGERCFNFGAFSKSKSTNPILMLGTIGSDPELSDIWIEGSDISPVNTSFFLNYKTGILTVQSRGGGKTNFYQEPETYKTQNIYRNPARRRMVAMKGFNNILTLGDENNLARFEFVWNLTPEETLKIIEKRISGASEEVRRDCLWTPDSQFPKTKHRIGHFTLNQLGSGAFGKVCKTVDIHSGDIVAVKTLHGLSKDDPHWQRALRMSREREVKIHAKVKHPYILPFLGSQELSEGELEIFMPAMQESLAKLVSRGQVTVTSKMRQTVFVQMLSALDYLDNQGIIHRDVKPDNILYEIDHQGSYIFKLADFGLTNYEARAKTQAGPSYWMSPEIFNGNKQWAKSDMWCLFITMMWVSDLGGFRQLSSKKAFNHPKAVQAWCVNLCARNNPKVPIRDMAIYDPEYRASAAEMLIQQKRQDLMTSRNVRPLSSKHFHNWWNLVLSGRNEYSREIRTLLSTRYY
ncbi:hypothetical protein M426DRAFT_25132 [Hypoxylon sp. CI-4A]|nr:hypothetical protein M426DRAFT_25132 [Hypoxylon sp. CI-4A]